MDSDVTHVDNISLAWKQIGGVEDLSADIYPLKYENLNVSIDNKRVLKRPTDDLVDIMTTQTSYKTPINLN